LTGAIEPSGIDGIATVVVLGVGAEVVAEASWEVDGSEAEVEAEVVEA
jgi:hypothetical protein